MGLLVAALSLFALWLAWGWLTWRRTLEVARRLDGLLPLPRFLLSAGALVLSGAVLIGGWLAASALNGNTERLGVVGFAVLLVVGMLFVSLQMFGACLMWQAGTQVTSSGFPASKPQSDHNRQEEGEQE